MLWGMRIWMLIVALLWPAATLAQGPAVEAARRYREAHGARILSDYAELLSIPNVPADPAGLRRTAEAIRDALAERGARAELLEHGDSPPIVFGLLKAPGAQRTVGIYVHYDGQPVDPQRWTHPPFEPVLYTAAIESGGRPRPFPAADEPIDPEWRIYARSAGDDKAPLAAIFSALDALREAGMTPSSNLLFFFEGEEERGSTHLRPYLEAQRAQLDPVDLWLICDGPVHQNRRPQLVFGVRGYTGLDITVYGAKRNLHSGHYGNWAPNPALELSRLLAGMKDEHGRVQVEGFYDDVAPISDRERAALARVPAVDAALREELGLARTQGAPDSLAERLLLPSLNVRGLQSATVGSSARNIIPRIAEAAIDIRLVKGNDPVRIVEKVERHIAGRGFHIVRQDPDHRTRLAHPKIAKVVRRPGYKAARTPIDLPAVEPVIAAAEAAAGEPVILQPSLGGSLPLYLFTELLGRPLVIVPIANHDDNQHAPDENLRLANLWYGIDLFAALFSMP